MNALAVPQIQKGEKLALSGSNLFASSNAQGYFCTRDFQSD